MEACTILGRGRGMCKYCDMAEDLLRRHGYKCVKHNTVPQIYIGGKRVGGYTDLVRHLKKRGSKKNERSRSRARRRTTARATRRPGRSRARKKPTKRGKPRR